MKRSLLCGLFLVAACASEPTGGTKDAGPSLEPTPVGACEPNEVAKGNSQHVGAYCSPGGGQCAEYPGTFCAIDLDPEGDDFCIKLGCKSHADCGEEACCTGRASNPIKACVPIACVSEIGGECPPVPGLEDAGAGDGGDMDAGDMDAGAMDAGGP